ncbi:MAG TPA: 6,7-dimethyl-8-ribityllumazine synthase [Bacteroidales bacterium]|jgi:6,7-dimethyl-8-ribityllumazine synthase|nr:6,7-dimethyl-8-ribityllumazine synthase [Bacteroidales bacterium]HPS71423.1 6,7-dimethyl-8-ribityllumazine synthase [Bacteroidales bacterium]
MKKTNLSEHSATFPKANKFKIGIVVSEWNPTVTNALKEGALFTLLDHGVLEANVAIHQVPGSFELPLGAAMLLDADDELDGVICLGCVIQGETRHFDFISQAVANGAMKVGLDYEVPVIFGVLTCDTMEQAVDRSGGKHGNKGVEAAYTVLKMIELQRKLK